MCGRFTLTKDEDFIDYRFSKKSVAKLNPNYNIVPSTSIAVISQLYSEQISMMKWGWSKSLASTSSLIINARCETVLEKSFYKTAIQNHRCLIIADAYIEWKSTQFGKQPYLIKFENNELFTFAGFARKIPNNKSKNAYECVILTTNANKSVNHIHNRMPLILSRELENVWINNKLKDEDLKQIILSIPEINFTTFPIDKKINKVFNNYPDLLNPIPGNLSLFD